MNHLSRLRNWYTAQCDGDWEHSYGIKLDTLDNPGWQLYIDLVDTELEHKPFNAVLRGDSEDDADWLHCKVDAGKFEAAGGIQNLPDMLESFLQWAGYRGLTVHSSRTRIGVPFKCLGGGASSSAPDQHVTGRLNSGVRAHTMAVRLLSIATLLAGAGFTVLFYIVMPMAWDARCSMEPCPALNLSRRLTEASVPFVGAALLVLVAWHIGKRSQTLARAILAVPLALAIIWIALLFGPLAG